MKQYVSRSARRQFFMKLALVCAVPALGANAAEPARKKYTKERVGYRDEPYKERTCAKCVLYVGHGECAIVEGEVKAEGWCTQWTPATMGEAASSSAA